MSKPSEAFEQAYDNFLAGVDVDTTMLDCAEFMFNAGRESVGEGEPVAHAVIAGVLFDFMGWLASRDERIVLSSRDYSSPAVDAIHQFSEMRGFSLDGARVQDWQAATHSAQPVQPAGAQGEAVAWRPILQHPIPWVTGKPQESDIRHWASQGCEIEYAYTHPAQPVQPAACQYCNGTGDVHGIDGEWQGQCSECKPTGAQGEPVAMLREVVSQYKQMHNWRIRHQCEHPEPGAEQKESLHRAALALAMSAAEKFLEAQPAGAQGEPVAWRINFGNGFHSAWVDGKPSEKVLNHWLKQGRKLDFAYTHPAQPVQPAGAQEPVGEVVEEKIAPWCPPHATVKWFKTNFDIGTKFYTAPPSAAINEQMLEALKAADAVFEYVHKDPEQVRKIVKAAIAEAEAAKKGGV